MLLNDGYSINRLAKAVAKNKTASIIVRRKINFSAPLLVRYTALSPPKAEPSPEPFCCIKITTIKRMEITI